MKNVFTALIVFVIFWIGSHYFPEYIEVNNTKTLIIASLLYFVSCIAIIVILAFIVGVVIMIGTWLSSVIYRMPKYTYQIDNITDENGQPNPLRFNNRIDAVNTAIQLGFNDRIIKKSITKRGTLIEKLSKIKETISDSVIFVVLIFIFAFAVFLGITPIVLFSMTKSLDGFVIHGGFKTYCVLSLLLTIFVYGNAMVTKKKEEA